MSEPMTPKRYAAAAAYLAAQERELAELRRLQGCNDPIECGHEAALGQAETALDEVMKERDDYHELLDRFAYTVAPVEVIGEHSSANDPWINALELLTPAADVRRLTEERDQAIAHDHQPYPTQWAYDQACAALEKHRQRADKAEADRDRYRTALESAALSVEHDRDSTKCRDRAAHRERISLCQHTAGFDDHDEDCPACDVQAALRPPTTGEGER